LQKLWLDGFLSKPTRAPAFGNDVEDGVLRFGWLTFGG
jgi:hypothetical protein